jgi:hypothetical protein
VAELQERGRHGGSAYVVRREEGGPEVARFSAHASVPGLAVKRAESDLLRLGLIEPHEHHRKGRKGRMPTVTTEMRAATNELLPRIERQLEALDGDLVARRRALANRAVKIVEEAGMEQFGGGGKSPPGDVAVESVRGVLDLGRSFGATNIERWTLALDVMEREGAAAKNGQPAEEPAVAAGLMPDHIAAVPLSEITELREAKELAESVVADVEAERDAAQQQVKDLIDELGAADAKIEEREQLIGTLGTRIAEAEAAAQAKPMPDEPDVQHLRTRIEGLEQSLVEEQMGRRQSYFETLLGKLPHTAKEVDDGARELLERLDALVGITTPTITVEALVGRKRRGA